jgi:hypothetical protein
MPKTMRRKEAQWTVGSAYFESDEKMATIIGAASHFIL